LKHDLGGVVGAVIGVADIENPCFFYQNVLGLMLSFMILNILKMI
jgi:hypothetical protein